MIYTLEHDSHRTADPELHVPGRRAEPAVRDRGHDRDDRRGRGLRHRLRDGPLLPAPAHRAAASSRCSTRTPCSARWPRAPSASRLGTLVTGVTYRNPAQLAKAVTALDVISGGRALLGIGAAWFEEEHAALGFEFPPLSVRYEHLEDALQICRAMFTEEQSTVKGTHHQIVDAWNSPRPLTPGRPADPRRRHRREEDVPARRAVRGRAQHQRRVRRDAAQARRARRSPRPARPRRGPTSRPRASARSSSARPTTTRPRSSPRCCRRAASPTRARSSTTPAARNAVLPRLFFGDPDEVVGQVHDLLATGLDGVVVNMLGDGHDPDAVQLAGETLTRAFAG